MPGLPIERKYDRRHKPAILRAHFEDGLPAREAARRARSEGLYGLPPWDMNPSTASSWVGQERARRRGGPATKLTVDQAEDALGQLRARLIHTAEHHMRRIEREVKKRSGAQTMETVSGLIRAQAIATREIANIVLPSEQKRAPSKKGQKVPKKGEGKDGGGAKRATSELERRLRASERGTKIRDANGAVGGDQGAGQDEAGSAEPAPGEHDPAVR